MEPSNARGPKWHNPWLPRLVVRHQGHIFKKRDCMEFQPILLPVPGSRRVDELLGQNVRLHIKREWTLQFNSSRKH